MFDTCFRNRGIPAFTHYSQNAHSYLTFCAFLTCLTHLSQNMCFQLLHIHMFQKTCDFMVYTLLTQCVISTWVLHMLWHVWHMFQKTCEFIGTCFRNMCFYLGFVHIVDNMRNATLVFTRFAMVFHIFGNMSFYMGFVHVIGNMCNFALVFAHVVWFLMHFSDNM